MAIKDDILKAISFETNLTHVSCLQVSVSVLFDEYKWPRPRCEKVLKELLSDNLIWVDLAPEEATYWFPAIFQAKRDIIED